MTVDMPVHLVTTQGVYSCITLKKSIWTPLERESDKGEEFTVKFSSIRYCPLLALLLDEEIKINLNEWGKY